MFSADPALWKLLEGIKEIFMAFLIPTKGTENPGHKLPKVLPSIDFLLDQYQKALAGNTPIRVLSLMIYCNNPTDR